jgi:hypothetical protein
MVRMAARYGHFALEELRSAVESISRPEIQEESPVNPPGMAEVKSQRITKQLKRNGSSGRIRTYNPSVNSRMLCH